MKNPDHNKSAPVNQQAHISLQNDDSSADRVNEITSNRLIKMNLVELTDAIRAFQSGGELTIPSAWVFERPELDLMLTHPSGETVAGIMAYAINSNGHLKIALVPYYENDANQKYHFTGEALNAYDFSDMVPSAEGGHEHAAQNDDMFEVIRAMRMYVSQSAT